MKHCLYFLLASLLFIVTGCKKSVNSTWPFANDKQIEPVIKKGSTSGSASGISDNPTPKITYPFFFEATGPFTYTPLSATIMKIYQDFSISDALPFPLGSGYIEGYDDLSIPTFPDRFFNGTFKFTGDGNDAVFGTGTVQTSVFSDPINPAAGDFTGSENFTGTFIITGGTGRYINALGSGTYTAHSEWRPGTMPGMLFSGSTEMTGTGTVSVVPHNGQAN